jgi:SAM-dependent MidA family methyltransferase
MTGALYGPSGFYRRAAPAAHFRTSVHASALFAGAVVVLADRLSAALGGPLDVVDVGAGRGELLTGIAALAPGRFRLTAVEVADRPPGLPAEIRWTGETPECTGLLIANEWLDNVPLDVAEGGRRILVGPDGSESPGPVLDDAERDWLGTWWPGRGRAEIGLSRDQAWAGAVAKVRRGLAIAVDYGHLAGARPEGGSLTGYRDGRQVPPVPDGSCDLTAHVAMDSLGGSLVRQRDALGSLGVSGVRPPRELASADPARYLRELAAASEAAELLDRHGLGAFWWSVTRIGLPSRHDGDPLDLDQR